MKGEEFERAKIVNDEGQQVIYVWEMNFIIWRIVMIWVDMNHVLVVGWLTQPPIYLVYIQTVSSSDLDSAHHPFAYTIPWRCRMEIVHHFVRQLLYNPLDDLTLVLNCLTQIFPKTQNTTILKHNRNSTSFSFPRCRFVPITEIDTRHSWDENYANASRIYARI